MLLHVAQLVTLLALALGEPCTSGGPIDQHNQQVVCYLTSWSMWRVLKGEFSFEKIDPCLCTTLIYAFVAIDNTTFAIKPLEPVYENDTNKELLAQEMLEKLRSLKSRNPRLKVLVSVGGWREGSGKFSYMASNPFGREVFIASVVEFIRHYGLDGLNMDWQYPTTGDGRPEDKNDFVTLVQGLRTEFVKHGWVLTAPVSGAKSTIETSYDLDELAKVFDYFYITGYNYNGAWKLHTGLNAPLYPREDQPLVEKYNNVDATVNLYLQSGVPANKLVLGVPFYGRTFILKDTANTEINAPSYNSSFGGRYTREDGFLAYFEICEELTTDPGVWQIKRQQADRVPYIFKDNKWISYDDNSSLREKAAYVQKKGLAGVMVWTMDMDDFNGACSQKGIRFPMLRAVNKGLSDYAEERPTTSTLDNEVDDDHYDGDDGRNSGVIASAASTFSPALSVAFGLALKITLAG